MFTLAAGLDNTQWLLLAAGMVLIVVLMMRANRRRADRLRGGEPTMTDRLHQAKAANEVRDQLDELMVQLEELARTTTAQIDTRCAKLEALLDEADAKIARLQTLAGAAEDRPADADTPPPANPVRPEHRQVYELSDAGHSPVQIAQQVGRDVGEVELILALRRR